MQSLFPVTLGNSLRKKEIHELVGGSGQHALTSCLGGLGFLVFHDPVKGKEFGYDRWEGAQLDGTFHYTGQGVNGDQMLRGPNKSLLQTVANGTPIHFFTRPEPGIKRKPGNPYTYCGTVALAEYPYSVKTAPDKSGALRNVLVFHFVPVTARFLAEQKISTKGDDSYICEFADWTASADTAVVGVSEASSKQIQLAENQLHQRFFNYLMQRGVIPERLTVSSPELKGRLVPDFVLRGSKLVVEAKPSVSRADVRLAIGQVLDYAHLMKRAGLDFKPALLFPMLPPMDLVDLIRDLEIVLITEEEMGNFNFGRTWL